MIVPCTVILVQKVNRNTRGFRAWWVSVRSSKRELFIINRESESQRWDCGSSDCLLWIDKARVKDKRYIWVSVWWKTTNKNKGIYAPPIHWVGLGTGTPKDRDEVNKREVCEFDGWVWELEAIGAPSKFRFTHKGDTLARMLPHFDYPSHPFFCLLWIDKARAKDKRYK
jgi:hypothetical protein